MSIFVFLFYQLLLPSQTPAVWERIQKRGLERIRSHNFGIPTQPWTYFFIFPKFLLQFEVLKEGFQHERGPVAQISPNLAGRPSVIDEPVDFSHFVPPAPLLPLWLPPKLLPYANYSPSSFSSTQWKIEEWFDGTDLSLINLKLTSFHDPIFNIITWINWVFLNW